MQLRSHKRRAGKVRETIAALAAGLVAAGGVSGAAAQSYDYGSGRSSDGYNESTGLPTLPYTELDVSLLKYNESGGRVEATEPQVSLTANGSGGQVLNFTIVADTLTGATPNGAVPSDQPQNFVTPIKATGSTATVTSASGGSTIIHLPPTPGQIAQAALGRQYTVPANALPVDRGFHDERWAGTFNWSQPLGGITQVGFGGGYSSEHDFSALTANANIAQSFNSNNTTVSLALNFESDSSFPYGGVPTPLTTMSAVWKTPSSRGRTSEEAVLGLTQVLTRRWIASLNFSYSTSNGYQNDPYRILSVVDATSGEPLQYLYENRPGTRTRQSVYLDTKYDLGPFLSEVQGRYYTDSWGVKAVTAEFSERVSLFKWLYVMPDVRWYHQTAANFFHNYLVNGDPIPAYASSDSRLGTFTGITYAGQLGIDLSHESSIYLRGGYYNQTGNGHPAGAIGQLAHQNLFAGVKATWVMVGYTWDFH